MTLENFRYGETLTVIIMGRHLKTNLSEMQLEPLQWTWIIIHKRTAKNTGHKHKSMESHLPSLLVEINHHPSLDTLNHMTSQKQNTPSSLTIVPTPPRTLNTFSSTSRPKTASNKTAGEQSSLATRLWSWKATTEWWRETRVEELI